MKKVHETTTFLLVTLPNTYRIKKNFTDRLSNKPFLIWLWTTPPHLKYVATLPFTCIINHSFSDINVPQGSVATNARSHRILNNQFTANLPRKFSTEKLQKWDKIWQNCGHEFVASLFQAILYTTTLHSYSITTDWSGLLLSPHREHWTRCRQSWSCWGRPLLYVANENILFQSAYTHRHTAWWLFVMCPWYPTMGWNTNTSVTVTAVILSREKHDAVMQLFPSCAKCDYDIITAAKRQ